MRRQKAQIWSHIAPKWDTCGWVRVSRITSIAKLLNKTARTLDGIEVAC
jgi:hypothetical protein